MDTFLFISTSGELNFTSDRTESNISIHKAMIALNNGTFIWEIMNEYWYQLSGKIFLQWAHGPSLQITMGQELASNKLIRTCCSLLYVMSALAFNVILVSW
jgi:hypothetical protein